MSYIANWELDTSNPNQWTLVCNDDILGARRENGKGRENGEKEILA